ncbi:MAG: DUF885 domain-containing protein [Bacteroidetes bacterium]|nr:DUF885 domain-containing protein [Bacteroidota bacterium]
MQKNLYTFLIISLSISICANSNEDKKLISFLDNYYKIHLSYFPIEATENGFYGYNDLFTITIDDDFIESHKIFLVNTLHSLKEFDTDSLSEKLKISHDLLTYQMHEKLESYKFSDNLFLIDQYHFLMQFIRMGSGKGSQPFKSLRDYDNFLRRIDGFIEGIHVAIINLSKGIEEGIVLPKRVTEKTLQVVRDLLSKDLYQNEFYQPVLYFPENFSPQHKVFYENVYKDMIEDKLLPAFKELEGFLSNTYIYKCSDDIGMSALPNGNEWYKQYIKHHTTLDIHPDSIMQIGLDEIVKTKSAMNELKGDAFPAANVFQYKDYLYKNSNLVYTAEKLLDQYDDIAEKIEDNISDYFTVIPESQFELEAIKDARSNYFGAHYIPSPKQSDPGVFYFDARSMSEYGRRANKSILLHEAIPGHHFQTSLSRENNSLPDFQKYSYNGGYSEGWALYAESLGKELEVYDSDLDLLIKLESDLYRAVRLVVDTGIHYRGWTYIQAINYFKNQTGSTTEYAIKEVERYITMPGQALSYKLGELKIIELRNYARNALGDKFSLKEFHTKILEDGALPLPILGEKIKRWVKKITLSTN